MSFAGPLFVMPPVPNAPDAVARSLPSSLLYRPPEKLFAEFESISSPAPDFLTAPPPVIAPESVYDAPLATLNVSVTPLAIS